MSNEYIIAWTHTRYTVTRERDLDDEWSGQDEDGSLTDFGVFLGSPNLKHRYYDQEEAITFEELGFKPEVGNEVFLVIENYDSGDSFSHTSNKHRPVKVFATHKDAYNFTLSKESDKYKDIDYFGGHNGWIIEPVRIELGLPTE